MSFKQHDKSSPLNSTPFYTHIMAIVTSLYPVYSWDGEMSAVSNLAKSEGEGVQGKVRHSAVDMATQLLPAFG